MNNHKDNIMLNYNDLRSKVDEILSQYDNKKIESWLSFDEKRAENENFINCKRVTITIEKPSEIDFLNIDCSFGEDEFYNEAA
jgi:6-pyruvoyl-tetrahydropterin synthase|tara:strand:+ start:416 stop:664 length:249 start_codon:yes stop_codon:yes gene_type:complete